MSPAKASAALRDAIFRAQGVEIFTAPTPCRHCPTCGSVVDQFAAIKRIQHIVAAYYDLPPEAMVSQRRGRAVAHPRQVAMFLSRELTPKSLPDIGRRFGGRDHTTVMHAIRAVKLRMAGSSLLRVEIASLKEAVNSPVDKGENPQTMSNSPPEYAKEHSGNGQEELAAA